MREIQLNQANLSSISSDIGTPVYDRSKLKSGIVHIGIGGFHRSHQAYYIHQLLQKYNALEWGICGIGLREADRKIYEVLKKQDYLYTLVTQHPGGEVNSEIVGSLTDFVLAVDSPELVIEKMASPDTKIVSLTITEGGYNFNPVNGEFNFENIDIQYELKHPNKPRTIYGYLTAALRLRSAKGLPPFTILSCDNIQHNGDVASKMLLSFAERQDKSLANWIRKKVSFPNCMVDRITPVTSKEAIKYLSQKHSILDAWPVVCEPFIQWVVEDKFSNGRPELEKLGVQFVEDVTPYEKMKIRLLNAGHSVLGILGAVHGHLSINACMDDQVFAAFMRKFMDIEVSPILEKVDGIDLKDYKDIIEERFANPNIKDSVSRICSESSAKIPKFLISTLGENLKKGGSIKLTTLVLATWCYYSDKGLNRKNEPIDIIDLLSTELHQSARKTSEDTLAFIRQKEIFGDLIFSENFTELYKDLVSKIYETGDVRDIMQEMLND